MAADRPVVAPPARAARVARPDGPGVVLLVRRPPPVGVVAEVVGVNRHAESVAVLTDLAESVERAANARGGMTPAEVARAAGVPLRSVLALVDGPIAHTTAARLLEWLGDGLDG